MDWENLRLKLRFTLIGAVALPTSRVLSTPNCKKLQTPLQLLPGRTLANRLEEQRGRRR